MFCHVFATNPTPLYNLVRFHCSGTGDNNMWQAAYCLQNCCKAWWCDCYLQQLGHIGKLVSQKSKSPKLFKLKVNPVSQTQRQLIESYSFAKTVPIILWPVKFSKLSHCARPAGADVEAGAQVGGRQEFIA